MRSRRALLVVAMAVACGADSGARLETAPESGGVIPRAPPPSPAPLQDADAATTHPSDPSPDAGGTVPDPTADAGVDAGPPYPKASGDPCRGLALPPDKHFVAKGLCARVVATMTVRLRQLTFTPNGDLWAATNDG